jgi:branched-chain amino acid transport system substrate-binding protein
VAELRQALAVYSLSEPAAGQQALEAFIKKHPKSPQVALAAALLARVQLHQGDVIGARALLERRAADSPDPAARFMRGLAEARGGQPQQALALLQAFAQTGPPPLGPEPDEAELALRAALGDARLATGDIAGAFAEWDQYLRQSNVRESEKAFARQRADEMAARVTPEAAAQAYKSKSELARAALGPRAAAGLRARGDNETARSLEEESSSLRRSLGFSTGAGGAGPGDPYRLGLLAPFSGPAFLLGEVVLRGAMLAIGEAGRSGEPTQFQIVARDAAEGAGGRAAFELVREEQAIGVVGVGDRRAVESALADGVPVLLLDEGLPGSGRTAFQVLHTPEARAAELARRALGLGARRFAILAPDTAGGRRLAEAFSRAATAQGGRITARAGYAANASAFTGPIGQLKKAQFEAVFVAEDARRLELIAPALAAADLWPAPFTGGKSPAARAPGAPPRREILLLSPAVGLGGQLLRNAGRYVQGALFAPGFYSDAEDPRAGGFVTQYRLLYGQDPGAADAYAYDAFRFMAAAVARGARSRLDLVKALGSDPFDGVTGQVRFGADHTRADPPPVYLVDGDAIRALR